MSISINLISTSYLFYEIIVFSSSSIARIPIFLYTCLSIVILRRVNTCLIDLINIDRKKTFIVVDYYYRVSALLDLDIIELLRFLLL